MLLGILLLINACFIVLSSLKKRVREENKSLALEMRVFKIVLFKTEDAFTREIEGEGINVGRFFKCGGCKSVNIASVN